MLKPDYDVVIVGAGMVGAALACMLDDSGLRVAVIEARPPQTHWPEGSVDLRVSAITAASRQIFSALGAWERMRAFGVSPFQEMQVWDAAGDGAVHFEAADIGAPYLGHIIENRVIQVALLAGIEQSAAVTLICPAAITALQQEGQAVRLSLADGRSLTTALVIGADGGNSRLRQLAGISTHGWSYDQQAVVAIVTTRLGHGETAWQRFLPEGPLAFLPLRDGRSAIVWSVSPAHARELLAMEAGVFCRALGAAFDRRLGEVLETGARAAFPLRLQHTERYIGHRLALVGDAAHMIHPLAGQGVNLGLLDAAALAEVLQDALAKGRDYFTSPVLRRYERWRKGDNLLTMLAMDGFKRCFSTDFPPLRMLRNTGLRLVDATPPLKHRLIRQAMGMKGDLPKLARGNCL